MEKIGELKSNTNIFIGELFWNKENCYVYERFKDQGKIKQIKRGIFARDIEESIKETNKLYNSNKNWGLVFTERKGA